MFDFKCGMSISAPEGLLDYGDDLVAATVANVLATALEAAGFTVASLGVKGHERTPVLRASYSPEADEADDESFVSVDGDLG